MVEARTGHMWQSLWGRLDALQSYARELRRLSQDEPLLQARPDYPRPPRPTRSYAAEIREVLDGIPRALREIQSRLPDVLPAGGPAAGAPSDEAPGTIMERLGVLARAAETLRLEAFQPAPPLPKHAPPYLLDSPQTPLAGSKAVFLSYGLEEAVAAIRNALLAHANAPGGASP